MRQDLLDTLPPYVPRYHDDDLFTDCDRGVPRNNRGLRRDAVSAWTPAVAMRQKRLSDDVLAYFRQHGARGGKKSSRAMTPAQRKARATKASRAAAVARSKKNQGPVRLGAGTGGKKLMPRGVRPAMPSSRGALPAFNPPPSPARKRRKLRTRWTPSDSRTSPAVASIGISRPPILRCRASGSGATPAATPKPSTAPRASEKAGRDTAATR
jgi:hypothetical protein